MRGLVILLLLIPFSASAAFKHEPAKGFHWYSQEREAKAQRVALPPPQSAPSPYEQLMALRQQTRNKLAKALLTPSFTATYDYMKAQQYYAKNNQQFVRFWQEVLLVHPELDHTLHFPTDNSAVALRNDASNRLMTNALQEGSNRYGLLLFYRGKSAISQQFINVLLPFVREYHFALISVATDGQAIQGLPNPKVIPLAVVQKTLAIEERYQPALLLVNLKTQTMAPLSYGFMSLTELKERFLDVVTHYQRFTYEGLGE